MHVQFSLVFLLRVIRVFGVFQGIMLFFRLKWNTGKAISVAGIPHPIYLRPKTSDLDTFVHVFIHKEYEIDWNQELHSIVDAGSNIGMFAIYMSIKYPMATILCLEPDPENFSQLIQNTASYTTITCLQKGVWNRDCYLSISDKFNWGKWAMIIEEEEDAGDVHCISIDTLMQIHQLTQLDVLKMDIETSEKEVFDKNYSNWLPKVSNIVIELHDRLKPNCTKTFFEALNVTFSSYSYSTSGENTIIRIKDGDGSAT